MKQWAKIMFTRIICQTFERELNYFTAKEKCYFRFYFLVSIQNIVILWAIVAPFASAGIRPVVNRLNQDTTVYYGLVFCAFPLPYMVKWHNSGIIKVFISHMYVLFSFLGSCRWSETNAWIKDLHSSSWRKQKLVNHLQVQTKHTICLLKHTSNRVTDWRDLNIAASPSALLPFPSLSIIWCVQTQLDNLWESLEHIEVNKFS